MNQINEMAASIPPAAGPERPDAGMLRALPIFSDLDGQVLGRLAAISEIRSHVPGTRLFEQGALNVPLFLVVTGQVSTFRTAPDGTVTVIDVVPPPGHLGLQAVLTRLATLTGAEVVSASRLIVVDGQGLLTLVAEEPSLASALLRAGALDLRSMVLQVCDLKLRTTAQRLGHYLLSLAPDPAGESATLRLPFDKRLLAARLGCRQENLSRAFATLRDIGVETRGASVTLKDLARLRAYAVAFDEPA